MRILYSAKNRKYKRDKSAFSRLNILEWIRETRSWKKNIEIVENEINPILIIEHQPRNSRINSILFINTLLYYLDFNICLYSILHYKFNIVNLKTSSIAYTDLASRGLDIIGVIHIFNVDKKIVGLNFFFGIEYIGTTLYRRRNYFEGRFYSGFK